MWSIVPAVIGVALLFWVRETRPRKDQPARWPSLRWSVLPRKLQLFLVIALLFTLGNSSNTFLLLRAQNLGFTPATAILLYLVYNVVYGLVSYPAGRLSDKIGRKRLLVAGYAFYGLVYLGFARVNAPQQAWILWALFGLYGLYIGFTEGIEKALVSDLAPASLRATAIGLHATIVGIGLFPASLIAGQLWDRIGPAAAFYFGGGTGLVAAIGLALVL
jgi:MFS family permease